MILCKALTRPDNNEIEEFDAINLSFLPSLVSLSLASNRISYLDITPFPNLRELDIESNQISDIVGLATLKNLQNISWRKQTISKAATMNLDECHEARSLFLSGNKIPKFIPQVAFLDLHHLELASVGLQDLAPGFGVKLPNLRYLNLNYNALKSLQPLFGIQKLEKLYLVGNRISRLRPTAKIIAHLGNSLKELDLRGNPLTIGFYPADSEHSSQETQIVMSGQCKAKIMKSKERYEGCGAIYLSSPIRDEVDEQYRQCLDEETLIRRRVYEILFKTLIASIGVLDGLRFRVPDIGIKDGICQRMIELGVIAKGGWPLDCI